MDKDSYKKTSFTPPKKEVKKEEPKKDVRAKAPSLKEAYPEIEALKNALHKGTDAEKKHIAALANAKTTDRSEILNIWRNS
tara:strand:+ start:2314 stop:2556 length:243 start_codon:yes stop_codon:yes gene_type:complete